ASKVAHQLPLNGCANRLKDRRHESGCNNAGRLASIARCKGENDMKATSTGVCGAAALALILAAGPAAAWEPTKPVEIVVAAGAGGASDQMARLIQAPDQNTTSII